MRSALRDGHPTEPASREGHHAGGGGSPLGIDTLLLAFASWTLGFWVALRFELGWAFSLGFSIVIGAALLLFQRRLPPGQADPVDDVDDARAMGVVLALVVVWPMAMELGRPALAVLAGAALGVRLLIPAARRRFGRADVATIVIPLVALLTTLAVATGWTLVVLVLCLVAGVAVVRPALPGGLFPAEDAGGSSTALQPSSTRPTRTILPNLLLGLFGALLAVWHVGIIWWSSDNAYYLNKAIHYSQSATSFEVQDHLFGVDGAMHYPLGNILSSFEPLIGAASAISGVSVSRILFQIVVPLVMFFVPFAMRGAAKGLGARRPNLAAAFASASILLMTGTSTSSLYATASYGKTIGWLVAIPLLLGAAGRLVRSRDARSVLRVALAATCTVGLSPSVTASAVLVLVPFTAAALWAHWTARSSGARPPARELARLAVPGALLAGYALYARGLQRSAGDVQTTDGFVVLRGPELAWDAAFRAGLPPSRLTDLFLVGCVGIVPLVLRDPPRRRAAGLMILLIFGVAYSPWSFELVVHDLFGLEYFADRLLWALPISLIVGTALGAWDSRRTLGLLTALAATMALGLSGPDLTGTPQGRVRDGTVDVRSSPQEWPWEAGVPWWFEDAAAAIADATPSGGRFLAPPAVEEVTTGLHIDLLPTYVREVYLLPIGQADPPPDDFHLEDRLLLARGMRSGAPEVGPERWREALQNLAVATVCTDQQTDASLLETVSETYSPIGPVGVCVELWSRAPRGLAVEEGAVIDP